MKGLCYEKEIDLTLNRQMVELIYRLSAKDGKEKALHLIEEHSLFWETPNQGMEEAYGLHYPGEVLERLGEKTELTKPKIRALLLALGDTKEIQEEGMFVGSQLLVFTKRAFQKVLPGDCYALAAGFLLAEKGKKEAYERLLGYPFSTCGEMLFALSVLPEDEALWEKIKAPLNQCFGAGRILDVFEEAEYYLWLSLHLERRMKGYRKKDLENLKYLARLSKEPAREGSTARKKLLEAGYSLAEVLFLNAFFFEAGTFEFQRDSIPAERLAIEFCRFVLNGEEVYPEHMYALCDAFLKSYREFSIKLEGAEGILKYLEEGIRLKNCRSYQCLYPHKEDSYRYRTKESIFYIDLTDSRWDPLYAWLGEKEFGLRAAQTISGKEYTNAALSKYLEHYEALTGKPYASIFWEEPQSFLESGVFRRLAEAGILDPASLAGKHVGQQKESREDTGASWAHMFDYLCAYMRNLQSPEAFAVWAVYMEAWDSLKEPVKISIEQLTLESFEIHTWGDGRNCFRDMELIRPFLTAEEHGRMFQWLDQIVFRKMTEQYPFFLARILEEPDTILWMPKEEAEEICFRILPRLNDTYYEKSLKKQYMEAEEFERQEQAERNREKQKKKMEEKKELKKLKKSFTRWMAGKDQVQRLELESFLYGCRYPWREEGEKMAASYLRSFFGKTTTMVLSKHQAVKLLKLEVGLFEEGHLSLGTMINTARSMEVRDDA